MLRNAGAFILAIVLVANGGCVLIDTRVKDEAITPLGASPFSGRYLCGASYTSHEMGLMGPSKLSDTLGGPACESAALSYDVNAGLTVSFEKGGETLARRTIDRRTGLSVSEAGGLVIGSGSCGGGLGLGCYKTNLRLYVNRSGDLVIVQSGGGAGMLLLLPFAAYGRMMGVFPQLKPDAL